MTADTSPSSEPIEAVIDTLLARDESISIVDGLFALAGDGASEVGSDEWQRAVRSRLQTRLVERMRKVIKAGEGRSASAA